MLDYSRFASDEHEEEDHTRMDRRRFVRRAGFRFLGPSTIEEGKGRAAWHSDACVALGLIGHGIRANKHRAGGRAGGVTGVGMHAVSNGSRGAQ